MASQHAEAIDLDSKLKGVVIRGTVARLAEGVGGSRCDALAAQTLSVSASAGRRARFRETRSRASQLTSWEAVAAAAAAYAAS